MSETKEPKILYHTDGDYVPKSALDAANAEIDLLKENVSSTLDLDHRWCEKYFALQSQLTAANAKVERLESVLKKLSDEMQVFLNVSQKIHFPDAREAQAQALGILTKIQAPLTEER